MRRYEEQVSPPVRRKVLVATCCDLCGAVAKGDNWDADASVYDVNEAEVTVTVRQKEGANYPDGGSGTEIVVDICPKCFKETLVPFLREKGATIEERDWDW